MRTALDAGAAATVETWRDDTGRELLAKHPTPGEVRARREIPEIGVTVLTLSNGVEVWLKPTDFRNDQITFTAARVEASPSRRRRIPRRVAQRVARQHLRCRRILACRPGQGACGSYRQCLGVRLHLHGISGDAPDLETALQLVYLHFTASITTRRHSR